MGKTDVRTVETVDRPFRVFLSHKVSKRGHAAVKLAEVIQNAGGGPSRIRMFVSPEIKPGAEWNKEVRRELHEADVLILLYTDPSVDMDWCLYETGFFAALSEREKEARGRLVGIVPPDLPIPGPLQDRQVVVLTRDGIRDLLEVLLNDETNPVRPDLFTGKSVDRLETVVQEVLRAIGPAESRRPLSPRVWIRISLDDEESLCSGRLPDTALIRGEAEAFREFGLSATEALSFSEFADRLEFADALPFFCRLLAGKMCAVLRGAIGRFTLPPIRVRTRGVARTLVFTYLSTLPDGDLEFEFVVTEPWWPLDEKGDTPSRLFQLLDVGMRFRQRVIRQHLEPLQNIDESQTYRVSLELEQLQDDIGATILDSMNRGIRARAKVLNQFEPGSVERARVEEMIGRGGRWSVAYEELLQATANADRTAAAAALGDMEEINRIMNVTIATRIANLLDKSDAVPRAAKTHFNPFVKIEIANALRCTPDDLWLSKVVLSANAHAAFLKAAPPRTFGQLFAGIADPSAPDPWLLDLCDRIRAAARGQMIQPVQTTVSAPGFGRAFRPIVHFIEGDHDAPRQQVHIMFLEDARVVQSSGIPPTVRILAVLTREAFRFRYEVIGEYLSRELTHEDIPGLRAALVSIREDFDAHGFTPEQIEEAYGGLEPEEARRVGGLMKRWSELRKPDGSGEFDRALEVEDIPGIQAILKELSGLAHEYTGIIARHFAEVIQQTPP